MSEKIRYLISAISSVAAIVFMVFFCKYAMSLIGHATGASTTLPLKMQDVYFAFPIGAVLLILFSIDVAAKNFMKFLGKEHGEAEKGGDKK